MKKLFILFAIFLLPLASASLNVTFTNGTLNNTFQMNFNLDYENMTGYQIDICFDNNIEFLGATANSPFENDLKIIKNNTNKSTMAIVTLGDAISGSSDVGFISFKLNNQTTLQICKAEVLENGVVVNPIFQEFHVFNGMNITNITEPEGEDEPEVVEEEEQSSGGDGGGSSGGGNHRDVTQPEPRVNETEEFVEVIELTPKGDEPKKPAEEIRPSGTWKYLIYTGLFFLLSILLWIFTRREG